MATNLLINVESHGDADWLVFVLNGKWAGQLSVPRGSGPRLAHALQTGPVTVAEHVPLPLLETG